MLTMRKSLQQLHCSVIGLAVLAATSLGSTGILDGNVAQASQYTNAVVKVNLSEHSDGSGSGVVVKVEKMSNKRNKYSIVTNEHVVSSGKKGTTGVKIEVVLPNGKKRTYTDAKVADLPYERCSEKRQVLYGLKQKNEVCYYLNSDKF